MLMLYNGVEALALKEQPVSTDDAIVLMKKTAFENGYVKKVIELFLLLDTQLLQKHELT